MTAQALRATAEELLAGNRGILAMDESIVTRNRRFAAAGIAQGCGEITEEVLREPFASLHTQRVTLGAVIPKPNMVLLGSGCAEQPSAEEVADATLACLLRAVPAAVPGIAFLSGGQAGELASAGLNAMNLRSRACAPWALGFSFGGAIQQPALETCHGEDANVTAAQQALRHRARCNQMSPRGEHSAEAERTAA